MLGLVATAPNDAAAQTTPRTNVGQLVSGLINVNIGAIVVNDVVDVSDVLNDNQVEILNNVLNNSPILSNNSEILTNLLRDADILNDLQVVVGVLSGGIVVVQDIPAP
jgi:hypothetical protein